MVSWAEIQAYSMQDRIQVLHKHATYIMSIRYYSYKVNLFLLGNEFVEVFINHKRASIDKIDLLDRSHTRMKFYSDQIKLPL